MSKLYDLDQDAYRVILPIAVLKNSKDTIKEFILQT